MTRSPRPSPSSARRPSWRAFIFSSLLAAALPALEFGPPLAPPQRAISSSFGEYRTNHLHAGLDFSTGGRNGIPVLAVADGEIRMIKITHRGYGRALYLTHADGYLSVYAHLERFSDAVERRIASTLAAAPYPGTVDLAPPVAVRAGEVVAYSGESGEGLPHLHFELRLDNAPVSPAPWYRDATPGTTRMNRLAFIPAAPATAVNGRWDRVVVPLPRREPVTVTGPFTLSLQGMDFWEGRHRGLLGAELRVDGEAVASLSLDRFDFTEYRGARFLYEKRATRFSPSFFSYWLLPQPGNPLSFFRGPAALDLAPGEHRLEVRARGLSSAASETLTVSVRPPKGAPPRSSKMDFFPTHFLFPGLPPQAWPSTFRTFRANGLTVHAGMAPPGVPVVLGPYSITHEEDRPIPLALYLTYEGAGPLAALAPVLHMEPKDLGTTGKFKVEARIPGVPRPEQVGFYRAYGTRWHGGSWKGDTLTEILFGPEDFAVLRDDRPPAIGSVSLSGGRLRVVCSDRETGIPWDGFQALAGGKEHWLEYDPDHNTAAGSVPAKGALTLRVRDHAGNQATRNIR
jgi:hypothetical protein